MKISNVLFFSLLALVAVYLFINENILENYIFPYIEIAGILFNNLFTIILIITIAFVILNIYRKIL
ncbi:MAG TPA: hypothetical protein PLM75_10830 [bacterium]|nr:hypothetical protein [bacterium]